MNRIADRVQVELTGRDGAPYIATGLVVARSPCRVKVWIKGGVSYWVRNAAVVNNLEIR